MEDGQGRVKCADVGRRGSPDGDAAQLMVVRNIKFQSKKLAIVSKSLVYLQLSRVVLHS